MGKGKDAPGRYGVSFGSLDFKEFMEIIGLVTQSVKTKEENPLTQNLTEEKMFKIGQKSKEIGEFEKQNSEPLGTEYYDPSTEGLTRDTVEYNKQQGRKTSPEGYLRTIYLEPRQ